MPPSGRGGRRGGRGHRSNCEVILHPDGLAEAKISTQDIGTGTRTVIAIVLAESALLGAVGSAAGIALGTALAEAGLKWLGGDLGDRQPERRCRRGGGCGREFVQVEHTADRIGGVQPD